MSASIQTAHDAARAWVDATLSEEDRQALFEPIDVGGVRLGNRIVMSAMGTRFATPQGLVTDRHVAYYARRARGGTGAVMVEGSSMDPTGTTYPRKPRLYEDQFVPGLARIAQAIVHEGSIAGIQLMHAGRHASPKSRSGPALSPSGGGSYSQTTGSREITEAEIQSVVEHFAAAAARAKRAGFQLIEVHGAHGYLIHDFLSPLSNRRDDAWGGDHAHRAALLVEVVRAIRAAVGEDVGLLVRLSSTEFDPDGITVVEAAASAVLAEQAGADLVLVSGGNNEHLEWVVPPVFVPGGLYIDNAATIRADVSIPVGVVGRIATPQLAARAVRSGAADVVFLGRALLADPDFVDRMRGAVAGPVRPCIACNECLAQHMRDESILCTVNPAAGREREEEAIEPAAAPRRIVVVGAGPAGMLFSALAARRGHDVTLVERADRTGGKLWLAAAAPYKTTEMLALKDSLARDLADAGVHVVVNAGERLADVVAEWPPDLVVLASGATPLVYAPTSDDVTDAEAYLADDAVTAWSSVAVLGAGDTACDAAVRLAEQGVEVSMLARGDRVARGIEPVSSRMLRRRLRDLGVRVLLQTRIDSIEQGTITYRDASDETHTLVVDQVLHARGVEATGMRASDALEGVVATRVIGDADLPGNFLTSMRSAWELAAEI